MCASRGEPGGCHVNVARRGGHWAVSGAEQAQQTQQQRQDEGLEEQCNCLLCDDCATLTLSRPRNSVNSPRLSTTAHLVPTKRPRPTNEGSLASVDTASTNDKSKETTSTDATATASAADAAPQLTSHGSWQRICVASLPRATVANRDSTHPPWYWDQLLSLPCLQVADDPAHPACERAIEVIHSLEEPVLMEDVRLVAQLLRLGNMTSVDGSVRQFSEVELGSPRIGKSLEDLRSSVTRYVKACMSLLLAPAEARTEEQSQALAQRQQKRELELQSPQPGIPKASLSTPDPSKAVQSSGDKTSNAGSARRGSEQARAGKDSRGLAQPRPSSGRRRSSVQRAVSASAREPHPFLSWDHEVLLLRSLKALLGNQTWAIHGFDPHVYRYLLRSAKVTLKTLATEGESRIYPLVRDFFTDVKVPADSKPRLDNSGALLYKEALKKPLKQSFGQLRPHKYELLVILEYLARLFDPFFQRAAQDMAKATNGKWRAAPPKTCARMAAKLSNDHAHEPEPKAAANLDLARAALTFEHPQDLLQCYDMCSEMGLRAVRVKNNFRSSFDAVKQSFGYRSILGNFRTELPVTWGELFDYDGSGFLPRFYRVGEIVIVSKTVEWFGRRTGTIRGFDGSSRHVLLSYNHLADDRHREDKLGPDSIPVSLLIELNAATRTVALQSWQVPDSLRHVPRLEDLVTRLQFTLFNNTRFRNAAAVFIVEIQFLLTEYLKMRRMSHIWYKLVRTPYPTDLVADFYTYAGVRRGTSFLLEALRDDDESSINYFAHLKAPFPPEQVLACRDASTGRTPLHYVAMQPDGRYNSLLEPILSVSVLEVNRLDRQGHSAHAVAMSAGNHEAAAAIERHPAFNSDWDAVSALFQATSCEMSDRGRTHSASDSLWSRNPRCATSTGWRNATGWCSDAPLSQWFGLTVQASAQRIQRIIHMDLDRNGLRGMASTSTRMKIL